MPNRRFSVNFPRIWGCGQNMILPPRELCVPSPLILALQCSIIRSSVVMGILSQREVSGPKHPHLLIFDLNWDVFVLDTQIERVSTIMRYFYVNINIYPHSWFLTFVLMFS